MERNADKHYTKLEKILSKRPVCSVCKQPIQENEYIVIDNECMCEACEEANASALWFEFGREMYLERGNNVTE